MLEASIRPLCGFIFSDYLPHLIPFGLELHIFLLESFRIRSALQSCIDPTVNAFFEKDYARDCPLVTLRDNHEK